ADIIAGSQAFISAEEKRVETMLAEIERDREGAVALFAAARAAERGAAELRSRLEREIQDILREREVILRSARAEASASVEDLRRELDRAEAELTMHGSAPVSVLSNLRERLAVAELEQAPLLAPTQKTKPVPERMRPEPTKVRTIGAGDRVVLIQSGQ